MTCIAKFIKGLRYTLSNIRLYCPKVKGVRGTNGSLIILHIHDVTLGTAKGRQ